ncbi:MAG: selenide, water dikinase SelD [Pseudomonadota bacterium]
MPAPIARDLVLLGGGHAHVIVLRMLGMNPVPGLQVTLVSPDVQTPYSGMLPGVVAGHYTADDIHIDLAPLCQFAGARFVRAAARGIDLKNRVVLCDDRPDINYDVLSIDIGITPALAPIQGAAEHGIAVKPINHFLDKWDKYLVRARAGEVNATGFVGAGAGGVELALSVAYRLAREVPDHRISLHLFADSDRLLPGYPERVQAAVFERAGELGIEVHTGFRASAFDGATLTSTDNRTVALDQAFFVTQAAPQQWLADTGLQLDERGFVSVGDTLQSVSHPEVFAVGDIASSTTHPRPKAGVYAVRSGPPLYRNIKRLLLNRSARPFKPQAEFLSLITMGGRTAVASRNGLTARGRWVWYWKDQIDRRFMARFNKLPGPIKVRQTGLLAEFDEQMRCGGCGSKVSGDLLQEVLGELGLGAGLDDAAIYEVPAGKTMLHSVDGFRAFFDDPYLFAKVAVNHALSDIYAMGGTPVTALAMLTLPYAKPPKTRALLYQLLRGASEQLAAEGVTLCGGHTSEGMELSIGFAVNGIVDRDKLLQKAGLQPGDCLILTRALGTGTVFAAHMQGRARGGWVEAALAGMLLSNGAAARILETGGAHALTDVTGFGLAGHLLEMLRASGRSARLDLARLPILPGALELLANGIKSTLHADNQNAAALIKAVDDPRYALLFDPQTAGGLLAGVPGTQAAALVASLRAAGYADAVVIGEVLDGPEATIRFE